MKKWQIVFACFLVSVPMGIVMYQLYYAKPQPEDLAPETKPHIENK